ncbi:MAG: peptide-methionine (S)-S-oxide reductase MsrA [Vicingus serpentipes]|nr:peptide-methionine (S)-S-oxide reductase MsrA [Vicingus serpentipes]
MKTKLSSALIITFFLLANFNLKATSKNFQTKNMDTITFGAGCFWCVEAIFESLKGVEKVVSGYAGGSVKNPSYKEVCTGSTGHAEVCQLTYNPEVISLKELLEVFWQTHDPTTLNRQGGDVGTQYRSAIFYHTLEQKHIAESYLKTLNDEKAFPNPIVTEITAINNFYPAEDYHQNYFEQNGDQPYCRAVVRPKLDKFKKIFKEKLK